jgi:putative Holliday junction resolvase
MDQRVLAIDLGEKRIGLAVSDPLGSFGVGLDTLDRKSEDQVLTALKALCDRYDVGRIIIGLPKNMNGTEGPKAEESREFAAWLESELPNIPIELMDERLTSRMAEASLRDQGIQPSRQKGLIDQLAAQRLVQDYLDRQAFLNRNP